MKFDADSVIIKSLKTPGWVRGSVQYHFLDGDIKPEVLSMQGQTAIHEMAYVTRNGVEVPMRLTKLEIDSQTARFNADKVKETTYVLSLTFHEHIVQELVHVVMDE